MVLAFITHCTRILMRTDTLVCSRSCAFHQATGKLGVRNVSMENLSSGKNSTSPTW